MTIIIVEEKFVGQAIPYIISPKKHNKIQPPLMYNRGSHPRTVVDFRGASCSPGKANESFMGLLETYAARWFPLVATGKFEILNIACGSAGETRSLCEFVEQRTGLVNGGVRLWGVDVDRKAIESARELAEAYAQVSYQASYIEGDAARLEDCHQVPDEVDLVIIRHQQIHDRGANWRKILFNALGRLRVNGVFVVTSLSIEEHTIAMGVVNEFASSSQDIEVVEDTRNKHTVPIFPGSRVFQDQFVAVIRRLEH